ncbi:platelet endothelial aggregation receptor 1-like [Haliotis asinina]|uniref:platelet endothelial aggregation receptor 1-like n=1 Tax=Haliotis asinina TaxID=109174 RepID=UPI0035323457
MPVAAMDAIDIQEWTFKMNHQTIDFNLSVLHEKPGISRIQCIVECSQSKGCFFLEYKRSGSICTKYRLFRKEDGKAAFTSSGPDVDSFTMNDPRGQHHGETCSCHVDCVDDRTHCMDHVCKCLTGYSLNREDESCMKDPQRLHLGEVCSTDAECVDGRTLCADNVCQCMTGYSLKHGDPACTRDPKDQHYGDVCTRSSDCVDNRTQCIDGQCKCQAGYSFNPRDRSCVEKCDKYGTTFSLLSYEYCSHGFSDRTHRAFNSKKCGRKCMRCRSFICRSFELWRGTCYLSQHTKLVVPDKDWRPFAGCRHYQRNCASD